MEIPLTEQQKDFAAANHGLVHAFLNAYGLNEDEFYDVVIFGYLRAVRRYFTEANLKKYKFGTIAWNCMRVDLLNHYKANRRQKRNAEVVSIHVCLSHDGLPLEHSLPSRNDLMEQLEAKLLLENLTVDPLHFTCNHASNYLPLKGGLPEDRDRFLAMLDRALAGEQELRPEWSRGF